MKKLLAALLCLPLAALAADPVVGPGKEVRIAYSVLADGRLVDSAGAGDPVAFVVGIGAMMPGLEAALAGLREGEEKSFEVAPGQAYGEIDPAAIRNLPVTILPPGLKAEPGMELEVRASGDEVVKGVVRSVAGDRVVLDFNHPLAGKTLTFKVRVVAIGDPRPADDAYPRAVRTARKYPGLLRVNQAGTVYLPVEGRNEDPAEAAALFGQLKSDAGTALLQCGMQIVGVEARGDIVKTYGVLNSATRATLHGLADRYTGTITEAGVLAALLAPYAEPEQRSRRPLACTLLLASLTRDNAALDRQLRQEVCPRIERLAACLDDLRVADRRLSEQAGPYGRRLYSGARWDSQVNYLDQFAAPGR